MEIKKKTLFKKTTKKNRIKTIKTEIHDKELHWHSTLNLTYYNKPAHDQEIIGCLTTNWLKKKKTTDSSKLKD